MASAPEAKSAPSDLMYRNIAVGAHSVAGFCPLTVIGCDTESAAERVRVKAREQLDKVRADLRSKAGKTITIINIATGATGFCVAHVRRRTHPAVMEVLDERARLYDQLLAEAKRDWGVTISEHNYKIVSKTEQGQDVQFEGKDESGKVTPVDIRVTPAVPARIYLHDVTFV